MTSRRRIAFLCVLIIALIGAGRAFAEESVTFPFFGVTHIDRTESSPRSLRMHIITIDLNDPDLHFLVTPQTGPRDTTIQTTLQFLGAQAAQIAINAHFFTPFPDDGTGYTWLIGLAASSGTNGPHGHAYAPFDRNMGYPYQNDLPALNIQADNTAAVVYQASGDVTGYGTDPPVTLYNAVCGNEQILRDGVNVAGTTAWDNTLNPRTAIGIAPGQTLVLFTVDGRQPGVSEGMTTGEIANLLHLDYGVTDAINLDGGGSTTLAMADPSPRVINVPVGVANVPGTERLVGSNLGVLARACAPETEGVLCGDDGAPCNGELVCRSGACVNDPGVAAVHLVPQGGATIPGLYRARDIADNDYAARFYTRAGDPDYTASDYDQSKVTVAFKRTGSRFEGSLDARGLKPNFAYQIKLVGMPTGKYGAAGDDVSNERIGYAGRWYRVGVGNATDAQVQACHADPQCQDIFEGYLVFDFFLTDEHGNATHSFVAEDSFHVLWRDCPTGRPLTGCQGPGGRPTVYQDVVAQASAGYGYDRDYTTWRIGVFGEVERTAPQSYLPDGEYRSRFVLTEESFHESGIPGGNWASAIGEAGIHFWINRPAGPRDCGDWDLCNGYESCDGNGACQAGPGGTCDDHDPCTDDTCDAESGCYRTFNTSPCSDGDACTIDDACSGGSCLGGPALNCDDGNACTNDLCAPAVGCTRTNNTVACSDGLYCNGFEVCADGVCQPGTAVACDDGIACTNDSCDEGTDSCSHAPCVVGVSAEGSRHIVVAPPAGLAAVALRVSSAGLACLPKYVDAAGRFTTSPLFQSSAQWGTVHIGDRPVVPSTTYTVAAELLDGTLIGSGTTTTGAWGNADGQGDVNIFDIICVLDGFQNIFTRCSRDADDQKAGVPDLLIDLDDIVATLDSFSGATYPDTDPCSGFVHLTSTSTRPSRPRAGVGLLVDSSWNHIERDVLKGSTGFGLRINGGHNLYRGGTARCNGRTSGPAGDGSSDFCDAGTGSTSCGGSYVPSRM